MSLRLLLYGTIFFLALTVLFFSCQKELSCEDCMGSNLPPVAHAGKDELVKLPKDSVILDGSTSIDADGKITVYQWKKITGPAAAQLVAMDTAKTMVRALTAGVYQFELTVIDNGGLLAKDTVQVVVDDAAVNWPPIACAGADLVLTLPTNIATLDGYCSTDPDNNITTYQWTKIQGPPSFSINAANAAASAVSGLEEGDYFFELIVTDAGGLSAKDTVQISVRKAVGAIVCDDSRPHVNAQLIPIGKLSQARTGIAVASQGSKILFAGGWTGSQHSSRVDIFDLSTQSWTTAELSIARSLIAATSNDNKIFFGGGEEGDGTSPVDVVDIYDATANNWTVSKLSIPGNSIAAAAVGDKVLFAGGDGGFNWNRSIIVDIYNMSTNTWSKAPLSNEGKRTGHTAIAVNNKVYIAGGEAWPDLRIPGTWYCSNRIDVYDNPTNTWSADFLAEGKLGLSGIAVQNKVYWTGGETGAFPSLRPTCTVEIKEVNAGSSIVQNLSRPVGWSTAVLKDNKIIFFAVGDTDKFDIYDIATNSWSIGVLPIPIVRASIIAVNNTIYIAGIQNNGTVSDQLWKLDL